MNENEEREEICESFRLAANKRQQIGILAELYDTDKETVVEILRDAGLYVRECMCRRCGKRYKRLLAPVCRQCEEIEAKEKLRKEARKKWVDYQIRQNEQRAASLLRQAALLKLENDRLKASV